MIRNTALAVGFCSQLDNVLTFKHVVKTTVQPCSPPSLCHLDSLVTCGPQAGGPGTRWLLWLFPWLIIQLLDHVTLTRFSKLSKWIKRFKNSFIIGTAGVINNEKIMELVQPWRCFFLGYFAHICAFPHEACCHLLAHADTGKILNTSLNSSFK